MEATRLRGARTHNLKSVDLDLRPGELVVVAGVSGAGKSSLALDTLYAEGQRRFVESFSAYARQFLERRDRPPVDLLDPVPAAIAVDRGAPVRTSRSTVGTMTELQDYLRLLWVRASTLSCEQCGREVRRGSVTAATDAVLEFAHAHAHAGATRAAVTYPVTVGDAERYLGVRESLLEAGYRRALRGGRAVDLDVLAPSEVLAAGGLDVLVDRLALDAAERSRIAEAIGTAFARGPRADVHVFVEGAEAPTVLRFARGLECAHCARAYPDPSPGLFSFQSPLGACPQCRGFGRTIELDYDKVVPDPSLSIEQGAIKPWTGPKASWERSQLAKFCAKQGIATNKPWSTLSERARDAILRTGEPGKKGYYSVRAWFDWLETRTYKMHVRVFLSRFRRYETCRACGGSRLRPEVARYRVAGLSIIDAGRVSVSSLDERLASVDQRDEASARVLHEIRARLGYLVRVGLGYLTLERPSRTLSGGEVQRVALTAALGTSLTGTLMVLDEPTVGLHPRDAARLIDVARGLAALGNAPVVVEHDLSFIASADRVLELGPSAGEQGGRLVFDGAPSALVDARTPTGAALRDTRPVERAVRAPKGFLRLVNARGNNLKNVTVRVPRACFTCVTGVSGSGKSTLVGDTLYPALARALGQTEAESPLAFDALEGTEGLRDVVYVDQSPLGRTSRGNAATYLDAYAPLRARFAQHPEAKARGYTAGTFSFNVEGGRCPSCAGEGFETVEMQFLADVSFRCPDCGGRRFRDEVLEVRVDDWSIADVLDASAERVFDHFGPKMPALSRALQPLLDVGLGYLALGQPLSMLSGGEAQRLKLARALGEAREGSVVLLDEPTAGLHRRDVAAVLAAIDALVDRGVTVVAVEHDPYVAARADWIIDVGPEAGDAGGELVAEGAPREVAANDRARIATFLREALEGSPATRLAESVEAQRDRASRDPATARAIVVEGAREHTLRIPRVEIPREKLVLVTGPSGSGKSSLAFDVVYAEGQRRFLETLSPYARQYLPSLGRADVDQIAGIPPAISLEQRTARAGAMSTVATVTECAHHLRLLFARAGTPYCPKCDLPIGARAPEQVADEVAKGLPAGARARVWAPAVRGRKGLHKDVFERALRSGIETVRVDGHEYDAAQAPALAKSREHDVWLEAGVCDAHDREALVALVRRAAMLAQGQCVLEPFVAEGAKRTAAKALAPIEVSTRRACPRCGRGVPELDPRHFSFNTKQGQCPSCEGAGVDENGETCGSCDGTRLAALPRSVRLGTLRIHELMGQTPGEVREALAALALAKREEAIAEAPLKELRGRLETLESLGLDYLALDRRADTLSGGEMQRLRLAAQLGAGLTGVLYVLDEPTIGLHASDTWRLIGAMRRLVERGASVLVVEHDAEVIRAADHVIDVGPAGGRGGGLVVAQGTVDEVLANEQSPTARSLRVEPGAEARHRAVGDETPWLAIEGVRAHNLRDVSARIPLGKLVCVAGVSGSGKSTLVERVLVPAVHRALGGEGGDEPLPFAKLHGVSHLRAVRLVDQSPIGRTPRSVPATYVGLWDELRKMLAATPEARARGWNAGRFSFNTSPEKGGGRCEACDGGGVKNVEMSFLPDVVVPCEVCEGLRFSRETRAVTLHGYNAGEILALTVDEARAVFSQVSTLARPLGLLSDLGLGYLSLGQGSHTLSGGEAQRVKLATELQGRGGGVLYVLDEPTTGLHLGDVERLVRVLQKLVDRGDSVLVVEHHPSVLAAADWLLELGPGGGVHGGRVVASATPREIATRDTATGRVLRESLARDAHRAADTGRSGEEPAHEGSGTTAVSPSAADARRGRATEGAPSASTAAPKRAKRGAATRVAPASTSARGASSVEHAPAGAREHPTPAATKKPSAPKATTTSSRAADAAKPRAVARARSKTPGAAVRKNRV